VTLQNVIFFGKSASISGDTITVGAHLATVGGSVYVFDRNQGGANNWGEVAKLKADDGAGGDFFGLSASISGDTITVGASSDDNAGGTNSGSAYVFDRNQEGINNWGQVKKLTASDAAASDQFGGSVSISGDTITVGAQFDDIVGIGEGSAYVFKRNQEGINNWGELIKLTASDAANVDLFGTSVSISGDTVVVGADNNESSTGSAYVFFTSCIIETALNVDTIISSSCTVTSNVVAGGSVIVQSGAVMTIPNGVTLDIDFAKFNLKVEAGGEVLIESGGKIT